MLFADPVFGEWNFFTFGRDAVSILNFQGFFGRVGFKNMATVIIDAVFIGDTSRFLNSLGIAAATL